jgi:hypothetical protein
VNGIGPEITDHPDQSEGDRRVRERWMIAASGGISVRPRQLECQSFHPSDCQPTVPLRRTQSFVPDGRHENLMVTSRELLGEQLLLELGAAEQGRVEVCGDQDAKSHG